MSTLNQLVDDVLLALNGYGAPAPRASFLSGAVTASGLTFTVTSAADFNQGIAEVGDELVYIESVNTATNTLTISADGRGFYGTTAAAHAAGDRVTMNPTWPRIRVEAAINDAIEGTYPVLFGVASTSFTFTGVQTTYELPAACEQVLSVTADTIGPSEEQQVIRRYSFNSVAPTDEFATGNSITLHEAAAPGRTVTVTYRIAPAAITSADEFTVSGLRGTAWKAVKYAACSELLAYMDTARLPVDTAAAAEYGERNQIGSASRISAQLYQRYEIELERERRRLASTTPVPINVRGR